MPRPRRHVEPEPDTSDRWLISYADFITLLFALFVVMYAVSSVNEGKYRVLGESMAQAFRPELDAMMNIRPAQTGDAAFALIAARRSATEAARERQREQVRAHDTQLSELLSPLVKQGAAQMTSGAFGIRIDLAADFMFPPGQAVVREDMVKTLTAIAAVLAYSDLPLTVEGHTDDRPIAGGPFRSNWELSAGRAAAVTRLLAQGGIAGARLTASGYGDQRPLAPNADDAARARNRRVQIRLDIPNELGVASPSGGNQPVALPRGEPGTFNGSFPQ